MNFTGQSFGRYHILEQLGEGGMATVYKAYDTRLDTDVAVKVIRRSAFPPDQMDQMLKRFEREARSLAKLSHANIVGVIDYGEHEGAPYLVMEYLPGGTLKDKMGKPIPFREASRIILPIARALDFAHRNGMVHRDVKPSNILITSDGDPMLTDFGIAKILEAQGGATLTGTGVGIGTPEYMAPEQWTGQAGPSADVYSLGVVLFEMVTGHKPYEADTPAAVLLKQASDPLPDPRKLVGDLPDQVEHILLRALAKKPEDRFATMGDFASALESLLSESSTASVKPAATATVIVGSGAPKPEPAKATNLETIAVVDGKVPAPETVIAVQSAGQPPATGKSSGKGPSRWWIWAIVGVVAIGFIAVGIMTVFAPKVSSPNSLATLPADLVIIEKDTPTSPNAIPENPPEECSSPEVLCIGLVTHVGTIDDKSFNESAWEALKLAEAKLGARVQYIESTDAKDYGKNISSFADEGYDVIVTVGFALSEATTAAAELYPDVDFIGVDQFQSETISNVAGLNFPEDQAGFLVGALAAMMSKTGKIGAVCGTDAVPPVWRFGEGYRAGAAFVDPAVEMNVVYHNDVSFDKTFTDPEWGAVTANSMIDKGVDVIFGCGGKTGNGAVTAAAQAGKYAIGVDTDQYYSLPEAAPRMLSSAMKDITPGVFMLIESSYNNAFFGGNRMGGVNIAPYHDLENEVPDDVKARMITVANGLKTGEIKTNLSAPTLCDTDPLGCITIKPGETIHVAYMLATEGENQALGIDARNGTEIAITDLGGKILGHELRYDGINTQCDGDTGLAAAEALATDPTIVAVIGPSCSSEARMGLPLLSKAGYAVISPSSTAPDLTEPGNPNLFPGFLRTAWNDIVQGAAAADYAYNVLGIRTAATINDGSIYSDRLTRIFVDNFRKLGGNITTQEKMDSGQQDVSAILRGIANGKPEMVYFPIYQPGGSNVILQANTTPGLEEVLLMSADSLSTPDMVNSTGVAVEGLKVTGPIIRGEAYDTFVKMYEDRFGTKPISVFHAHAYDAIKMLESAIRNSAVVELDGTLHIGRQALRDALYATQNYNGISGTLTCTPTGDCANPVIGVYEFHTGEFPPTLVHPK